jgi:hypothetical protein
MMLTEETIVSRFSRLPGTQYRVWCPPGSSVRIEYAAGLFREARMFGPSGRLYGEWSENALRVDNAVRKGSEELVGIFSIRERGEVFLTEEELQRFEECDGKVALVIAGGKAGFFLRESDGSIQSLKSHEEIGLAERTARSWHWIPVVAAMIVAVVIAVSWMMRTQPLGLAVRDDAGQLHISWRPTRGAIEIRDGAVTRSVAVRPMVRSMTYVPQSADVQIRMTVGRRTETARYVAIDPVATLRGEIGRLETEQAMLTAQAALNRVRIAELESASSKMKRAE